MMISNTMKRMWWLKHEEGIIYIKKDFLKIPKRGHSFSQESQYYIIDFVIAKTRYSKRTTKHNRRSSNCEKNTTYFQYSMVRQIGSSLN